MQTKTRDTIISQMTGENLFGRTIRPDQKLKASGLICAASVMLDRGQSNIAYDIIMAGFALFEVSPGNLGMNAKELLDALAS